MDNSKVVYLHRKKTDGSPFYVGIGNEKRPFQMTKKRRSKLWWRTFEKYGCDVEIVQSGMSWSDACNLEKSLILKYGRVDIGTGTLVNHTDGGDGRTKSYVSKETRIKLSIANKGKKLTYSQSEEQIKNRDRSKPVVEIKSGKVYPSVTAAAKELGYSRTIMKQLLKTGRTTTGRSGKRIIQMRYESGHR